MNNFLRSSRIIRRLISGLGIATQESVAQARDQLLREFHTLDSAVTRNALLLERIRSRQLAEGPIDNCSYRVFSQFGEDGIIAWLLARLPNRTNTFIEIGASDYQESNTRLLAEHGGWRGLIVDSSEDYMRRLTQTSVYWRQHLTARAAFVTAENINDLIRSEGFDGRIDLLSIDIDGNDFWVWKALDVVQPAIVIIEYNSIFGANTAITIPYRAGFVRGAAHFTQLYFGASLGALVHLAEEKGYSLVAVETNGVNAFFLRHDLLGEIKPVDQRSAYRLTPVREALDPTGALTFLSGDDRIAAISHLEVVVVDEEYRLVPIADLDVRYT